MTDHPLVASAEALTAWNVPDTPICAAAWRLTSSVSAAYLSNHCVRSYLFGRELAAADGLRSGVDYDDETLFLACVLHDLGVTSYGGGEQRFEVDGADAAARFLREQGYPQDRVETVWQAIALHTSLGLAHRFGPIAAVAFSGISMDIDGAGKDRLPAGFLDRITADWPRHDLGYAIADAIARDIRADPRKAPPFSLPAHLHQLLNNAAPLTFIDVVTASGWGDRPLGT